jgi:hypothetical protein
MLEVHWLTSGIARACETLPSDFTFIIGNKTFVVPKFIAIIMSPLAHQLLVADSTVDQFHVSNISDNETCLFTELKDFYTGQNVEVKSDKIEIYYRVLESIGNIDVAKAILDIEFGCDPLSVSNAVNRLGKKRRLCVDYSVEEEFIASKFFQFSSDSLNQLKCEYLISIVKRPSLQLSSEDSLLQVISTFEMSPCRDELLCLVECEFLS